MEVIICPVGVTAKFHDCWLYHKPTKRMFYAPFGHHYQLVDYLMTNGYESVIADGWEGKGDSKNIRTGDVKHGYPRTAKENPVTAKGLRQHLIDAYNGARNITTAKPDTSCNWQFLKAGNHFVWPENPDKTYVVIDNDVTNKTLTFSGPTWDGSSYTWTYKYETLTPNYQLIAAFG